jgi:8-oxo-dGTP pyrophosphatase MutT (NUDIX family)
MSLLPHDGTAPNALEAVPLDYFVQATDRLHIADAVAALLVLPDGRYIMQRRDVLPHIFYPDHWGCFGGAVNEGESPLDALKREVHEELEYQVQTAREFVRFDFDFTNIGEPKVYRIFFEVQMPESALPHLVLHEGAAIEAVAGAELLSQRRVTPYDAFAIWLHMSQHRFLST